MSDGRTMCLATSHPRVPAILDMDVAFLPDGGVHLFFTNSAWKATSAERTYAIRYSVGEASFDGEAAGFTRHSGEPGYRVALTPEALAQFAEQGPVEVAIDGATIARLDLSALGAVSEKISDCLWRTQFFRNDEVDLGAAERRSRQ